MYGDGVLIVLLSYARPQNMPAVIRAWRDQSVQPKQVVVVDNQRYEKVAVDNPLDDSTFGEHWEEYPRYELSGNWPKKANGLDDVWRWTQNTGCPSRFAPALMLYGHKYVVFADDDFLPGKRAIEWLLKSATVLEDRFATLGQVGRRFAVEKTQMTPNPPIPEYSYQRGNWRRGEVEDVQVDMTCRAHMVKWDSVIHALAFRNEMLNGIGMVNRHVGLEQLVGVHDDFLLSCGVQRATGFPSYVIPTSNDPETELIKTEIPCGAESCYRRPGHYEERDQMCKIVGRAGWRSLL